MPRIVTAVTAAQRGAKRADGSAFVAPQKKAPEGDTIPSCTKVLHDFSPIDTAPMAAEIGKLAQVVAATLNAQAERLSQRNTGARGFEFTVTERDYNGRIVKMVAKPIGGAN